MFSSELNMVVAQNCRGYHPRYSYYPVGVGTASESCANCANFIRQKCVKDLRKDLINKIQLN